MTAPTPNPAAPPHAPDAPSKGEVAFGLCMVLLAYGVNLLFWMVVLPRLVLLNQTMGLRPTVWSDALASWAGLLAQQAKVILPLYVVLAVIHARAITRPSFGVRAVAWIGVILLILFTAAQVLALVLQQMVILHSAGSV